MHGETPGFELIKGGLAPAALPPPEAPVGATQLGPMPTAPKPLTTLLDTLADPAAATSHGASARGDDGAGKSVRVRTAYIMLDLAPLPT